MFFLKKIWPFFIVILLQVFLENPINSASSVLTNRQENSEYKPSECFICKEMLKCYRLSCEHQSCLSCLIKIIGTEKAIHYHQQCAECKNQFSGENKSLLEIFEKEFLGLGVSEKEQNPS
jgi:hypothetical protein